MLCDKKLLCTPFAVKRACLELIKENLAKHKKMKYETLRIIVQRETYVSTETFDKYVEILCLSGDIKKEEEYITWQRRDITDV